MQSVWMIVVVATLIVCGVPSNAAIIWIHSRKNSRLAKNKFPLIFASIDLFAILINLPLQRITDVLLIAGGTELVNRVLFEITNFTFLYIMQGYLFTLLVATAEKFYAITYPLKYRTKQNWFFKVGVFTATAVNAVVILFPTVIRLVATDDGRIMSIYPAIYTVGIAVIFLTIIALYVAIVVKILQKERKLTRVGPSISG